MMTAPNPPIEWPAIPRPAGARTVRNAESTHATSSREM